MRQGYEKLLIIVSDFLTGSRPVKYVRRMQLYLLVFTLIGTTFVLAYPIISRAEIDISPGGQWALGKNAPTSVIAITSLDYPRMRQFAIEREAAVNNAPLFFIRDFAVLGTPGGESSDGGKTGAPPSGQKGDTNSASGEEGTKTFRDYFSQDLEQLSLCREKHASLNDFRYCVRKNIPRWKKLSSRKLDALLTASPGRLKEKMEQAVNILFQRFVILKSPINESKFSGQTIRVRDINTGAEPQEKSLPSDAMMVRSRIYSDEVNDLFEEIAARKLTGLSEDFRDAIVYVAGRYLYMIGGSELNIEETEALRKEAASRIEIPFSRVNRGDMLIQKNEIITDEKLEAIQYYNQARFLDKIRRVIAIFVQQLLLIGAILYFTFRFGFRHLSDVSSNMIIFIVVWFFAFSLFLLGSIWGENPEYNEVNHIFGTWVPVGLFVVLLSTLFGEVITLPLGVYFSFLVFIASRYDHGSLLVALSTGITGSILGARIKQRVHFITTAFAITLVGFLTMTVSYLYGSRPILGTFAGFGLFSSNYIDALRMTFFSGISTIFVIAILPMFETLFNVPTRFKLQEISDPSSPLLQELFRKAPSTWTHTLMVAAMSEHACERLGLNVLLTRAGVYYHDLGKMKNPGFFIENHHLIPRPEKIDQNNPHLAARVIINHVLDGMEMARAARLPREVIAFIPEHHGTSTMSFFYHRALEKMRKKVNKDDFRYPGPRPQSKETAIVMLADSVEAASRSMEILTEKHVDDLVLKIIALKQGENQLDESGLTMGDLHIIREAFREIILSSYHNRPRYPDTQETKKLEEGHGKKNPRSKKSIKKTASSGSEKKSSSAGKGGSL